MSSVSGRPGSLPRTKSARVSSSASAARRARVSPSDPREGQAVRCEISGKSEDPDGDAVRYRISWFRNGVAQPFADTSQEVPARLVRSGDRWRCQVVPSDGEEDGPTAGSEEVEVGSAPIPQALGGSPGGGT